MGFYMPLSPSRGTFSPVGRVPNHRWMGLLTHRAGTSGAPLVRPSQAGDRASAVMVFDLQQHAGVRSNLARFSRRGLGHGRLHEERNAS